MKFKLFQFYKYLLFAFFLILSLESFSFSDIKKDTQFDEIKKIAILFDQYMYFHREIYSPENNVKNIEQWINYFEKEKHKYENTNDVIYVNFILVYLYRINYELDKAIELGLTTYYSNFENSFKDKFSCEILSIVEWCFHKKDNNLELIRINKEKFKVCGKKRVNYHAAYYNMGLYNLALLSFKKHIDYNKPSYKKYNLYDQAFHNNDIGVYYMYDNKIDSALYHYRKSISLFKKQDKKDSTYKKEDTEFMLAVAKGNIGTCLLMQGEYKKAIPLYLNEIKASNTYYKGRGWTGSEKLYNRIAYCFIKTNQFKKAKVYIDKLKKFKTLFYKSKSEYYMQLNNIDSTLFFKNKYITTSDSIYKQKLKQQEIDYLNRLDFNEKIKEQQDKITILEQQDNSKSLQIKIYLIISFVVLLLFLLLLYFYYNTAKKQKIVESQKNEIEVALSNNKILLKELNHRVKNNLQMVSSVISLQASKIKDEHSKKHFKSAINRIKVLSKIHNSLYAKNQLHKIDLLNYVVVLKDYLINSITNPEIKVKFILNIESDLYIDNDKKATIGLIINELITNSLKYGFDKEKNNLITISILKKQDYFYFSFTDNGKGFNYEAIDKSKSVGLNLILRLVNQLGEEATITSDKGIHVSFKFKTNN